MAKIETSPMTEGGLTKMLTCIKLTVCAGQPISFANIATRELASTALSSGDYTVANGDISGRKATVAQKANISITNSGTADHVVIDDGTNYIVTTCVSQALTAGGTITVPTWKKEIQALV